MEVQLDSSNLSRTLKEGYTTKSNEASNKCFRGDAEQAVEGVITKGFFFIPLKLLKREFGNPLVVCHLILKKLFGQPQIKVK